jgi:hypothetical protein
MINSTLPFVFEKKPRGLFTMPWNFYALWMLSLVMGSVGLLSLLSAAP